MSLFFTDISVLGSPHEVWEGTGKPDNAETAIAPVALDLLSLFDVVPSTLYLPPTIILSFTCLLSVSPATSI